MCVGQHDIFRIGPDIGVTGDGMGIPPDTRTNCRSDGELAAPTHAIGGPRLAFQPQEQVTPHGAGCDYLPP